MVIRIGGSSDLTLLFLYQCGISLMIVKLGETILFGNKAFTSVWAIFYINVYVICFMDSLYTAFRNHEIELQHRKFNIPNENFRYTQISHELFFYFRSL